MHKSPTASDRQFDTQLDQLEIIEPNLRVSLRNALGDILEAKTAEARRVGRIDSIIERFLAGSINARELSSKLLKFRRGSGSIGDDLCSYALRCESGEKLDYFITAVLRTDLAWSFLEEVCSRDRQLADYVTDFVSSESVPSAINLLPRSESFVNHSFAESILKNYRPETILPCLLRTLEEVYQDANLAENDPDAYFVKSEHISTLAIGVIEDILTSGGMVGFDELERLYLYSDWCSRFEAADLCVAQYPHTAHNIFLKAAVISQPEHPFGRENQHSAINDYLSRVMNGPVPPKTAVENLINLSETIDARESGIMFEICAQLLDQSLLGRGGANAVLARIIDDINREERSPLLLALLHCAKFSHHFEESHEMLKTIFMHDHEANLGNAFMLLQKERIFLFTLEDNGCISFDDETRRIPALAALSFIDIEVLLDWMKPDPERPGLSRQVRAVVDHVISNSTPAQVKRYLTRPLTSLLRSNPVYMRCVGGLVSMQPWNDSE